MVRLSRPIAPKRHPAYAFFLICAVSVACQQGQRVGAPGARDERIAIEATAPRGPVAFPLEFRWKASGMGADGVFRLTIYDEVERRVFERETREPAFKATPDVQALLSSSRRFLWRVAVLDGAGNVVAQTPLVDCTTR